MQGEIEKSGGSFKKNKKEFIPAKTVSVAKQGIEDKKTIEEKKIFSSSRIVKPPEEILKVSEPIISEKKEENIISIAEKPYQRVEEQLYIKKEIEEPRVEKPKAEKLEEPPLKQYRAKDYQ